jgi:hypothetical protein
MAGKVLHVSRDYKARAALVEFDRYRGPGDCSSEAPA